MPEPQLGPQHDAALGAIETVEARSLSWGYIDGSLSEPEAEAAVSATLAGQGADPAVILDELVEARLLRTWRDDGRRYRTRFAELVRLLVRSRQLFDGRPWRTAPSLVSDFRVDIRRRATPKPDVPSADALAEIVPNAGLTPLQRNIWLSIAPGAPHSGLRRFQVEASKRLLGAAVEHGTIVTAGTGSGKTLAFYLPALVTIADRLDPLDHWTQALCLYPRQELLKDQFTEAYRMCLRAGRILATSGRRPFSLGALYRGTPSQANARSLTQAGWKQQGGGFLCPFLRCPNCASEMRWHEADIARRTERLVCVRLGCGETTTADSIRLTRIAIRDRAPDLLFTTTEMLNQRMSDTWSRHIFGIGKPRAKRPHFVLLDEVHTYTGTSGAQVALLLRRWRHLLEAPIRWVGLSATLREAPQFFADLTGLKLDQVLEVTPRTADMEFWGAEYQLLLRGDPSSQSATLSTSIQAAMLIARMIDPDTSGPSQGRFGRRLFAFTDELDVTHRLFDDLRDAEAYDRFGRPDGNREPLANLRTSAGSDAEDREADGQRWALAESLRASLRNRLVVGRTTSRDPGVDGRADVIVATAALEVGFNDPDVGAVLQHKAPRSLAAFLQRRGRAGRRAGMRPVSVTVLSDYGRDRIAFQSYEHLFDPVVEREILPVRNIYVLRMQAVFALLDWLGARIASGGIRGWAWDTLSRPAGLPERGEFLPPDNHEFREAAKSLIQKIVRLDDTTINDLSRYLRDALGLTEAELQMVLWEPPRSLLLEAVPTLARRLFRDWKLAGRDGLDLFVLYHPLPDFIPRTLYNDLNLPEVVIDVPAATVNGEPKEEVMPVLQAINQFAPGRVRRRFADEYAGLAHWIPVDITQSDSRIAIGDYASRREHLGVFRGRVGGAEQEIAVYRPGRMRIAKTTAPVLPTSQGSWRWQSRFEYIGEPFMVDLPERSPWAVAMPRLDFFLHRFSAAVSQLRFAAEGSAEVRTRAGSVDVRYRLEDENGEPAAIGFAAELDTLRVRLQLPSRDVLGGREIAPDLDRWLRTLHLRRAIAFDNALPENVNLFRREWLFQIFLLATIARAEANAIGFGEAAAELGNGVDPDAFRRAAAALVNAVAFDEDDDYAGSRLEETLEEIFLCPGVVPQLVNLAHESFRLSGASRGEWIGSLLKNTLSEAILQACLVAAPANTALSGLTAEVIEQEGTAVALLAENTLGGGGTIESIAHAFSAEPRAFLRALEAALAPSDLEVAAASLERVLVLVRDDQNVATALQILRSAESVETRSRARDIFFENLGHRGVPVSHSLSVSIATRLLRPAASPATDALTLAMLHYWREVEGRHEIALPVRVAAALCGGSSHFRERLAAAGGEAGSEIGTANLLLWPRGGEVRLGALQSHNSFRAAALTDSALARVILLEGRVPSIRLGEPEWQKRVANELGGSDQVRLIAGPDQMGELRAAIVRLMAESVEAGYLHLHPVVEALRQLPEGGYALELSVRERN